MDLGIEGKVAVVLGAGGGLGSAIASALAREGVAVASCDISLDAAEQTAARIRDAGGRARAWSFDLASLDAGRHAWHGIEAHFGAPDILVNNSGGPPVAAVADVEPAAWRRHFDAMVVPLMHMAQLALPAMRARRWGRIVTSASSGVVTPIDGLGISNSLRAALVAWNKTLSREIAAEGITANIVVPGRIATTRIRQLDETRASKQGRSVDAVRADSADSIPMRRYGEPAEYADAVAFLASARASYITGSVVRVDGGLIPSL
jgi:3-oxoacyl-[acyl-carrier protein] reductase